MKQVAVMPLGDSYTSDSSSWMKKVVYGIK